MDSRRVRDALGQLPTGVTIIRTVTTGGDRLGMTISSFNSLSLEPPLVLFSIWREANSFVAWQQVERHAINVLSEDREELSNKFARAKGEKWIGQTVLSGETGLPLLPNAVLTFECEAYD
ncbi:MAG: flavin reductase family protein, partial [Pseudolabrys sp.]